MTKSWDLRLGYMVTCHCPHVGGVESFPFSCYIFLSGGVQ